jgi:hypothetical protein
MRRSSSPPLAGYEQLNRGALHSGLLQLPYGAAQFCDLAPKFGQFESQIRVHLPPRNGQQEQTKNI